MTLVTYIRCLFRSIHLNFVVNPLIETLPHSFECIKPDNNYGHDIHVILSRHVPNYIRPMLVLVEAKYCISWQYHQLKYDFLHDEYLFHPIIFYCSNVDSVIFSWYEITNNFAMLIIPRYLNIYIYRIYRTNIYTAVKLLTILAIIFLHMFLNIRMLTEN